MKLSQICDQLSKLLKTTPKPDDTLHHFNQATIHIVGSMQLKHFSYTDIPQNHKFMDETNFEVPKDLSADL